MADDLFDVFLSHNGRDKPAVIFEQSLGADHPKTRTARKNLTALCKVNVCEAAGVVGGGGTSA